MALAVLVLLGLALLSAAAATAVTQQEAAGTVSTKVSWHLVRTHIIVLG